MDESSFSEPRDVPRMNYADRQLLMVVNDDVAYVQRKAERNLLPLTEEAWKKEHSEGRVQTILANLDDDPAWMSLPATQNALVEVCRLFKKAREKQLDLLMVSKSEAQQLTFPIGHPRYRVMYVGHPSDPSFYVPMANFHRVMFEHKVAEAQHLLVALGATDIEIEHIVGAETSGEGGIAIADVGLKGGKNSAQSRRVSSKMKMQPHQAPEVPKDLIWYHHEPLWQEVARARLEAGLESFELEIRYTDDFGVNAKLNATVQGIGIDIGGSFKQQQQETWRLSGNFGPLPLSRSMLPEAPALPAAD